MFHATMHHQRLHEAGRSYSHRIIRTSGVRFTRLLRYLTEQVHQI